MHVILDFLRDVHELLSRPKLHLGTGEITPARILYVIVIFIVLNFISRRMRKWLIHRVLVRSGADLGTREAVGTIIHYGFVGAGTMILLMAAGVNLSSIAFLLGTLGVGIGLGLQAITSNFVSGLIILFERPIKVGDRIQMDDIIGDVSQISPRATTVNTNDNISVIVPNSEFISSRVINWSHSGRLVRIQAAVGVSYESDPEEVRRILLKVAAAHPGVLDDPAPDVMFEKFGESSLDFVLRVWTTDYIARPNVLISDLNFELWRRLKDGGIEIPFPQRDLHIRGGVLDVRRVDG